MIKANSKNFYHGVVFHLFHDKKIHKKAHGSLSSDDFLQIIKIIGRKNILDAEIFYEKLLEGKLEKNHVCFTFDDAHKSEIDIALPILEDFKIKSFFYVYSSVLEGKPDNLEIFRYFRTNYFQNINEFYILFYKNLNENLKNFFKKKEKIILEKKKRYPFYSIEDIKFRLVRSDFIKEKKFFEQIMFNLMKEKNFKAEDKYSTLFMNKDDIILLDKLGHKVGLHSHTHPIKIEKLSYEDQLKEYTENINILSKTIKRPIDYIKTASHPCGSYNDNSLNILKKLGIKLAFKDSMLIEKEKKMKKINNSNLEIARIDPFDIKNKN